MAEGLLFEAKAIERENSERWTFFFASTAPLSCLIFDHRLCPDCGAEVVEN